VSNKKVQKKVKSKPPAKKSGIQIVEEFIETCKKLDPSLKSIRINMTGDYNRTITRKF